MKKIKYIIVFILSLGIFNSCLIDNDTDLDKNGDGKNFVSFENTQTAIAAIADGEEYVFDVRIHLTGPSSMDLTGDLGVSVVANETSTAIEGTHYRIDNPTVTLTADNNHLVELKLTMLTAGIVTPLDKSPILVLNLTNATGNSTVIASGKPITISMDYACPSFLEGDYSVAVARDNGTNAAYDETITKVGIGKYLCIKVGTWGVLNADFGYEFTDVCNVITVPLHDLLADTYSNDLWGHKPGSVNPDTGVLTIYYTVEDIGEFTCIYTPK